VGRIVSEAAGRWRRVYSNEWHASSFQSLSDAERVVYFYCRTGPQSTSIGAYRVSAALAAEDVGNLTAVDFDVRLSAVCEAFRWRLDPPTRVLWMPNWVHENPPQSPNVLVSWRKLLRNLPDCDLKFEIADVINRLVKDLPEAWRKEWGKEPIKDLRISHSQPKAKAPSHQGNQGAGIQGSGNRGTDGLRRTTNGNGAERPPSSELVRLVANTTLKLPNAPNLPVQELVESVLNQHQHLRLSRRDATAIVEAALLERRPS